MARGTLSGFIWGTVIAVGGVAVVSLSTPMPPPPAVGTVESATTAPAVAPTAPEAPQTVTAPEDTESTSPASPTAPDADSLAALETADTAPAEAPDVGEAAPLAQSTDADSDAPEVTPSTEAAPAPAAGSVAPQAPQVSENLTISTEPAQPTAPSVADQSSGFGASDTAEDAPAETEVTDNDTSANAAAEEPAAAADEGAVAEEPAEDVVAQNAAEEDSASQTADAEVQETDGQTEAAASDPVSEANRTESDNAERVAPRIAELPRVSGGMDDAITPNTNGADAEQPADPATTESVTPSVQIGQRAGSLTQRDGATSALPNVRTATDPSSGSAAGLLDRADPEQMPISRFAAPFVNPDGKPLLSIVLIDAPGSIGAEALANFPYPLTFAVDPDDPDAVEKMARHRAAGFEVLAMVDLPLDATAQDAETALEVGLAALPEIVGVMEGVDSGIQGNRPLSDQVTAVLRDQGYGFVTQNSGLNTVQKLAAREGVPSAFIFRDFDGAGQTPTVMRRFLDQAAFRASQEGGVIMLGRVQPDTISALLLWGLQDRATRVALSPVSSVLMRQSSNP